MSGWAVVAGLAGDRLLGEPPDRAHPVAWFGTAMGAVERRLYAERRANGVAYAAVGVALGLGCGALLRRVLGPAPATALATAVAVAGRMLEREALGIDAHLDAGDLPAARSALRALVGRDPTHLDGSAVSRAVIESVAENTVDAVTAPICWALLGGAPAVLAHRAINTMDAMVGHRNARYERFGWAAARLDDAANWLPARLTAALVIAHGAPGRSWPGPPDTRRSLAVTVRRQARAHPSPNGGLIEAAYAHRIGVIIGGTNRYGERVEDRGLLGAGNPAGPGDIAAAVRLLRTLTAEAAAVCATSAVLVRAGGRLARRRAAHGGVHALARRALSPARGRGR